MIAVVAIPPPFSLISKSGIRSAFLYCGRVSDSQRVLPLAKSINIPRDFLISRRSSGFCETGLQKLFCILVGQDRIAISEVVELRLDVLVIEQFRPKQIMKERISLVLLIHMVMDMGRATWTQPVDNLPPNGTTRSRLPARFPCSRYIFGVCGLNTSALF